MGMLQLVQNVEEDSYRVEVVLKGDGGERRATTRFAWQMSARIARTSAGTWRTTSSTRSTRHPRSLPA
jgi:hypothetical protein